MGPPATKRHRRRRRRPRRSHAAGTVVTMQAPAVLSLPGMELGSNGRRVDAVFAVRRRAPNRWLLVVGDTGRSDAVVEADRPGVLPSEALSAVGTQSAVSVVAALELDRCGAWITLANVSGPRPVVVRRAGWVDVRGHPPGAIGDDRVGLGPGDAVVFFDPDGPCSSGGVVPGTTLDRLLDVVAADAPTLARSLPARDWSDRPVAVLRVPAEGNEDPLARVARATGIPTAELDLPGYPLGDSQPDLWRLPPTPPREARLHLDPEPVMVRKVRELLRRLLASWRLEELVASTDVELLATEVTSNAIRHAGTPAVVIIRYLGPALRVEVGDGSPALPALRRASPRDEGGRGLPLVHALSRQWGVIRTSAGKRVWFDVPVGRHDTAPPRRDLAPGVT
jgi:anti-sigma regulatory factor (Ser/Thr protein kinase)